MEVKVHKIILSILALIFVVLPLFTQSLIKEVDNSRLEPTERHSEAKPAERSDIRHSEAAGEESRVTQDPSVAPLSQESKEPEDSLIRLMSATSAQLYQENGEDYRRVVGSPAVFLHNNTYLYCDTAVLNVTTNILNSWGNVRIIQENTRLTGDRLIYLVDSSLAQFRGNIVRLENKEGDVLLTKHLDYNTKDSVAVFFKGASMRDKDGQIIESVDGRYESILKKFTFNKRVNMFSDTTFVKCDSLEYFSENNTAYFYRNVNAWHNNYMLSARNGVYNRDSEEFTFDKNVHLMDETCEGWCDRLKVYRSEKDFEMYDNAQLYDSDHNTSAMAGYILYRDTLKKVTLTRLPAIISILDGENAKPDSVFISADNMCYYTEIMCEMLDSTFKDKVKERKSELTVDPVGEHRKKAAEAARQALEEAMDNDPNLQGKRDAEKRAAENRHSEGSVATEESRAITDTIPTPPVKDSTKVDFMVALGNVKVYKTDIQIRCDSLLYNNYDSLARLFIDPVIWKEGTQQFNADSISMIIENGTFDRIFMMSNSFVQIRDVDTVFFNQIRSAEMIAYFDTTSNLSRYDALGDATALFYLEENGAIATANHKEAKMLSAEFMDGEISRVFYYDTPKSNAFSVASMSADDKFLKGFSWRSAERPKTRFDVTKYKIRPSERTHYSSIKQPEFKFTDVFFPGYIKKIRDEIQYRKDHPEARVKNKKEDTKPVAKLDTLESETKKDTLAVTPVTEVVAPIVQEEKDTTSLVSQAAPLTKKEIKAQKRQQRKNELQQKKEARWKAKDEKNKKKQEAREAKKKEKLRQNKLKALKELEEKERKENKVRQKYLEQLRAKALKKQSKKSKEPREQSPLPPPTKSVPEQNGDNSGKTLSERPLL